MSEPEGRRSGPLLPLLRDHLPVLLLVLVALSQLCLAWGVGLLNPDKGGGFGMFSTVDRLNHRHLRAYRVGPEGEEALDLAADPSLRPTLRRATSLPSDHHLREVAAQLLERHPARAIRVEVWKHHFAPTSLQIHPLQVASLTVEQPGR